MLMSSEQKINVSWLVNIILVPACTFFLYKTYDRMEKMQDAQTEMRVNLQDVSTRIQWVNATTNEQSAQIRELSRKVERLTEQGSEDRR